MQILQHSEGRWLVEGSKGACYHVEHWVAHGEPLSNSIGWACDCPGSLYGKECRHIKAVKAEIIAKNKAVAITANTKPYANNWGLGDRPNVGGRYQE